MERPIAASLQNGILTFEDGSTLSFCDLKAKLQNVVDALTPSRNSEEQAAIDILSKMIESPIEKMAD